jgi:hypothetical protein
VISVKANDLETKAESDYGKRKRKKRRQELGKVGL